jgi:hypothetical protein
MKRIKEADVEQFFDDVRFRSLDRLKISKLSYFRFRRKSEEPLGASEVAESVGVTS